MLTVEGSRRARVHHGRGRARQQRKEAKSWHAHSTACEGPGSTSTRETGHLRALSSQADHIRTANNDEHGSPFGEAPKCLPLAFLKQKST